MQDPTIHYEAAIDAVRNAHEAYNLAAVELADVETDLEIAVAKQFQENVEAAAYVAAGSNETARKERRAIWLNNHCSARIEELRQAKYEKAKAEMELDDAKRRYRLEADRIKLLLVGYGGADLLGSEPPAGRLPADPRLGPDGIAEVWPEEKTQ